MAFAAQRRPEDGIHTAEAGETISSIAALYGFTQWRERVYDAPQNAQLKLARPNPNTLVPGDEIYIPELADKVEPRPTDAWHVFHVVGNKRFLRLKLRNADDTPLADEPYRIEPRSSFRGRFLQQNAATSPDGVIEEPIPHTLTEADVVLTNLSMVIRLKIGHLLPLPMREPVQNAAADALASALGDVTGAADALGGIAGGASAAFSGEVSLGGDGASFGGDLSAAADGGAAALAKAGATVEAAAGALSDALGGLGGDGVDPNIYPAAQRLLSMGFKPGAPRDNRRTAAFTAALMAFQTWCKEQGNLADSAGGPLGGLTSPGSAFGGGGGPLGDIAAGVARPMLAAVGLTGQLDEPTIEALKKTHGC